MTDRANLLIDALRVRREAGEEMDVESTAVDLRQAGLDPAEAGWVLRHVFKKSLSEAVHIATMCDGRNAPIAAVTTKYATPPPAKASHRPGRPRLWEQRREQRRAPAVP